MHGYEDLSGDKTVYARGLYEAKLRFGKKKWRYGVPPDPFVEIRNRQTGAVLGQYRPQGKAETAAQLHQWARATARHRIRLHRLVDAKKSFLVTAAAVVAAVFSVLAYCRKVA